MTTKGTGYNIGLAIWRLKCFYETFMQGSTVAILLNFGAKNPPLHKATNVKLSKKNLERVRVRVMQACVHIWGELLCTLPPKNPPLCQAANSYVTPYESA